MMLESLRKGFRKAVDDNLSEYLIYYSGHGQKETGGWLVYLKEPTLDP